jgi:hypothetical protein
MLTVNPLDLAVGVSNIGVMPAESDEYVTDFAFARRGEEAAEMTTVPVDEGVMVKF